MSLPTGESACDPELSRVLDPANIPTGDSLRERTRLSEIRQLAEITKEVVKKLNQAADNGKTGVTLTVLRKYELSIHDFLLGQNLRTNPPLKRQTGETVDIYAYWSLN
jgi:hypothetical protein